MEDLIWHLKLFLIIAFVVFLIIRAKDDNLDEVFNENFDRLERDPSAWIDQLKYPRTNKEKK